MAIPISGRVKTLLINAPHTPSTLGGRDTEQGESHAAAPGLVGITGPPPPKFVFYEVAELGQGSLQLEATPCQVWYSLLWPLDRFLEPSWVLAPHFRDEDAVGVPESAPMAFTRLKLWASKPWHSPAALPWF